MMNNQFLSVVPWRTPEQFQKVYKYLYSDSISDKRWAVDQISVWETRCHPALPTAVEATVVLVRAVIQDMLHEVEKTLWQAKDVQMLYAMGLIRFVNLIIELDQNAQSKIYLSQLAIKRNIPSWIVELRHEAVHAHCPSLPVLRIATSCALEYLEDTFWKIEAENVRSIMLMPGTTEEDIKKLILQYRTIQLCRIDKKAEKSVLLQDLREVLVKIRKYLEHSKETVLNVLVKEGSFISSDDLKKILPSSAPLFLESDEVMCVTYLPTVLESFWLPMVRLLHQYDLISNFLEKLLLSQEGSSDNLCQKTAAAWVLRILTSALASSVHEPTTLDNLLREKGAFLDLKRILYACMKGINQFLISTFNLLVTHLGDKDRYHHLYSLVALYQGWFVGDNTPSVANKEAIIFTAEDVEEDIQEFKARKQADRMEKERNIWSLAPMSMDFSEIPLGAVLNDGEILNENQNESVSDIGEEPFIVNNENDTEIILATDVPPSRPVHEEEISYVVDIADMLYRHTQQRQES